MVQKFGGSSVSDGDRREKVLEKIAKARGDGFAVVVVISAMGRHPEPYATDSLIRLIKTCEDHDVCLRDKDLLMSCGEVISCVVMAQKLRDEGIDAVAMTGWQAGIITDDNFSESRILRICPDALKVELEKGRVPVVAGFQGITETGQITTLGRGGSDTTATALGAALKADAVEIYTDVEGVLTGDPRVMNDPRVIPEMHYTEAGEMSGEGAKVLHKRCIAPAFLHHIPLWVKPTLTNGRGTLVTDRDDQDDLPFEQRRVVTSIVQVENMAQMIVDLIDARERSLTRLELLRALKEAGVSIDQINIIREKFYFIVEEHNVMSVVGICKEMDIPLSINHGCAKVSCVGIGMKGTPGVMAAIQEALAGVGVNILQSTDSHITISCLIKQKQLQAAVSALADKFNLRG
jgi:aspartate kinase